MLDWYRAWIAARRAHPALRDPAPRATTVTHAGHALAIDRGELALVCNLSEQPQAADLRGEIVLASDGLANRSELPPLSCALVHR